MILDLLDNSSCYFGLPAWAEALHFATGLAPDTPDGNIEIRGRDIWAMVFSYTTQPLGQAVLESHREYVDIQVMLAGEEVQGCYPVRDLTPRTAYDPAGDILFFHHPAELTTGWRLRPGWFSAFLPQDAHLTKGLVGAPAPAKKVVVKVRCALLKG